MQNRLRLCTGALILTLIGCSCSQSYLDPPADRTINCVVATEAHDRTGTLRGSAAGIVLHHSGEHTYILTARHTVYLHEPFKPEDWGIPSFPFLRGAYREVLCVPIVLLEGERITGEVVWEDSALDAAVFRIPRIDRPEVYCWSQTPPWGAPALSVGMFVPGGLMMHFHGRFQGVSGKYLIFSSHSHGGCSGGGVFVYTEGEWALSGLLVAIGSNGDGILLHHVTYAIPIYKIVEAVEGGASSPLKADPPNPLPLDILREF